MGTPGSALGEMVTHFFSRGGFGPRQTGRTARDRRRGGWGDAILDDDTHGILLLNL